MADVFPMDDVVLDGCDTLNGHDNFSDDDCIEVGHSKDFLTLFICFVYLHIRIDI